MKKKIQQAFEHQTPDVLSSVLSSCENEKGELVVKNEKWQCATRYEKGKFHWLGFAAAAAIIALVIGIGIPLLKSTPEQTEQTQAQNGNSTPNEPTTEPTESTQGPEIPEHLDRPISYHTAMELALEDAQLETIRNYECEWAEGRYAISFKADTLCYYYTVDSTTGEILAKKIENNPSAADEQAAIDATLHFFEDFTAVTFLAEERDLTPHLVPADMEIWTRAEYFAPYAKTDNYRADFYLTNQRAYILEYAEYWCGVRKDVMIDHFKVSYEIESVYIKGGFAQVCLLEGKTFHYDREQVDSSLVDPYAVMLTEVDGQWVVFDIPCDNGGVQRPAYEQPPLVTEAYSGSYTAWDGKTWTCTYPQIMLESEYAAQVNEEIYEQIDDFRAWNPSENAAGISCAYDWYVHGDLLTLIVTDINQSFEEERTLTVYTLRTDSGAKATREELLSYAGMSEEAFVEKARWILANLYENDVAEEDLDNFLTWMENNPGKDGIGMRRAFGRTVCLQNMQELTPYLSKDGKLCFQAKVYQIAGADFHQEEYEIDKKVEKSPFYDRFMANCINHVFEIAAYECTDSVNKVMEQLGVTEQDVADLTCEVCYLPDDVSYHTISFRYGGEAHVYHIDIYTGEIIDL